jgi:hypothetical protein
LIKLRPNLPGPLPFVPSQQFQYLGAFEKRENTRLTATPTSSHSRRRRRNVHVAFRISSNIFQPRFRLFCWNAAFTAFSSVSFPFLSIQIAAVYHSISFPSFQSKAFSPCSLQFRLFHLIATFPPFSLQPFSFLRHSLSHNTIKWTPQNCKIANSNWPRWNNNLKKIQKTKKC